MDFFTGDKFLVSASHDFSAIIWNVEKGHIHQKLDGPSNYVKAVSADPLSRHIAMMSCDRILRIFSSTDKQPLDFNKKQNVFYLFPFQTEYTTEDENHPKLLLAESEIEK